MCPSFFDRWMPLQNRNRLSLFARAVSLDEGDHLDAKSWYAWRADDVVGDERFEMSAQDLHVRIPLCIRDRLVDHECRPADHVESTGTRAPVQVCSVEDGNQQYLADDGVQCVPQRNPLSGRRAVVPVHGQGSGIATCHPTRLRALADIAVA